MSLLDGSTSHLVAENGFAQELAVYLNTLRTALGHLLAEWGAPKSASALNRLSGAGLTNCWRVFRIVNAVDVAAEARHAPTPSSLKRMLLAASSAGVKPKTIAAVETAAEAFQEFAKRNAGDRAAFDSMLAGVSSDETTEKIHLTQRRAAYRAMSHIIGIHTDLYYVGAMVRRSAIGAGYDEVIFQVQRGVRRLRPGSQIMLAGYHGTPNASSGEIRPEAPLDPAMAKKYGMPLLPQFCTQPFPEVEVVKIPSGQVFYNTVGSEIGPRTDLNFTIGHRATNSSYMIDEDGRSLYRWTLTYTHKPVALGIQEVLVHRPSFPGVKPEMMVYQFQEWDRSMAAARRALQFPVEERLKFEGRADSVGLIDIPHYTDMLRLGATSTGWDLAEFDVYRLRMPYPIMLSSTRIFFYAE